MPERGGYSLNGSEDGLTNARPQEVECRLRDPGFTRATFGVMSRVAWRKNVASGIAYPALGPARTIRTARRYHQQRMTDAIMARAETASTRLPRGTGTVTKAFFAALDSVPDTMQATVAKAAQGAIRDELKRRLEKQRNAARAARMTSYPEERLPRAAAPARKTRQTRTPAVPAPEPLRRKPAGKTRTTRRQVAETDPG